MLGTVLCSALVDDLSSRRSATILSTRLEACVEVTANDALVANGARNVLETLRRMFVRVVLDKAKTTWRLGDAVQTHYDALYRSHRRKNLLNLQLRRKKGKIADIHSTGAFQYCHILLKRVVVFAVPTNVLRGLIHVVQVCHCGVLLNEVDACHTLSPRTVKRRLRANYPRYACLR
jgi:hypothetical protein